MATNKTDHIYGKEIKQQNVGTVMENVKNVAKGFSVARGMLKTKGRFLLFSHAHLSTIERYFNALAIAFVILLIL